VLAALASPPATKALDPDLFSRHSLRHAVYGTLLHFGIETAIQSKGFYGKELAAAANSGIIERFTGAGQIRVSLFGVRLASFPREIPFLAARDICQWMVSVNVTTDNSLAIVIPIRGGTYLGQSILVFPRAVFLDAEQPVVCAEPSFAVAYLPPLSDGPFKGRTNVICTGITLNVPPIGEAVRQGANSRGFFFIHKHI
ncbi:MAG: hypothetical protein ABSC37_11925, partial [Xanthobacteraceae bacterium]